MTDAGVEEMGSYTFAEIVSQAPLRVFAWRGLWRSDRYCCYRVWGWATVVVQRSQWVTKRKVEPAVWCCNAIRPLLWHLENEHRDDEGEFPKTGEWEAELKPGEFDVNAEAQEWPKGADRG